MCSRAGDVDLLILVFPFFLAIIGGFLILLTLFLLFTFFLFFSGSWLLPLCWLFPFRGDLGFLPFSQIFWGQVDKLRADIGVRMNASQVKHI